MITSSKWQTVIWCHSCAQNTGYIDIVFTHTLHLSRHDMLERGMNGDGVRHCCTQFLVLPATEPLCFKFLLVNWGKYMPHCFERWEDDL